MADDINRDIEINPKEFFTSFMYMLVGMIKSMEKANAIDMPLFLKSLEQDIEHAEQNGIPVDVHKLMIRFLDNKPKKPTFQVVPTQLDGDLES